MNEESQHVQYRYTAMFGIPEDRKSQLTCELAIVNNKESQSHRDCVHTRIFFHGAESSQQLLHPERVPGAP